MIVKHSCGHTVDIPARDAPFVERTLCYECEQLARRLTEEQQQRFNRALEPLVKEEK